MARTNIRTTRVKPDQVDLLTLRVLRSERISPHFIRVTFGGDDLARFRYMGFDQWFRLFIPVSDRSLAKAPRKFDTLAYARYLTIAKVDRPVLRNYTVRAYRPEGPELDVDFVVHGTGPAATWAQTCAPGDAVGILDEGIGFNPAPSITRFLLVADESGLPAVAGILASLPPEATGHAVIELPSIEDQQQLTAPSGIEITWVVRDSDAIPGQAALATSRPLPIQGAYGWVVGEQSLASGLRKHWVEAGLPKQDLMFCGYWRHRP
ncbi:NADPH-dependent ferric siderophore reductase [Actinokineospora baliensis]|uniref:siderophore-interacting protein n=1 Tax=Actinokineospora baliensis TaxID=547056 RepID=UPI001958DCAD|nr:siderophore-interacting protein [Actinokineospora baliensis]MBM7773924.1 NADPH-dependent ferric siderophore reductase [Actinokineospora baliensis]